MRGVCTGILILGPGGEGPENMACGLRGVRRNKGGREGARKAFQEKGAHMQKL